MKKHGHLIVTAFLVATVPLLSGCGTLLNISFPHGNPDCDHSNPEIYGGVSEDVNWAWQLLSDAPSGSYPAAVKIAQLVVAPCVLCIDLPLSAVADTLTLPVTVRSALHADKLQPASALEQEKVTPADSTNGRR